MSEQSEDQVVTTERSPRTRRLSDKVLLAFHMACDQGEFEVADRLLAIVEIMVRRPPPPGRPERRRGLDSLVAAHERLWALRHPNANER